MAQIPGADKVVDAAATHGWEAMFLVVLTLGIVSFFGFFLKQILTDARERERRLADRVTRLEDEIRQELITQLKATTEIMTRVVAAAEAMVNAANSIQDRIDHHDATLAVRPCLLGAFSHAKLVRVLQEIDENAKEVQ